MVEMETKFCLSSTSKEHGVVLTEEVPVVVHADWVLVTVLTGEGIGAVPAEEVIVGLPSWTYKSVTAAPRSRSITLPGVHNPGGNSTMPRPSGGSLLISLTGPQWPLFCSGLSSPLKRFPCTLR